MRQLVVLFSCLMVLLPLSHVHAEPETIVWWVEYDWTEADAAADSLAGISIQKLVEKIEDAAGSTEIELDIQYSLDGKSYIYSQHTDGGTETVRGGDGVHYDTEVRVTDYAIRHATKETATAISNWGDNKASFDVTASASSTQTAIIDLRVSEYVNSDLEIVMIRGESSGDLSIEGAIKADGFIAGKDDRIDFVNARVDYQASTGWSDFQLTWIPDTPLALYGSLGEVQEGESVRLECSYYANYNNRSLQSCARIEGSYSTSQSYEVTATNIPAGALGLSDYWQKITISDSFTREENFEANFSENDYYHKAGTGMLNLSGKEREVAFFESDMALPFGLIPFFSLMPLFDSFEGTEESIGNGTQREIEDVQRDYDEDKDRLIPIIEDFQYSTFEREFGRMMERFEEEEINPELGDYRVRYLFVYDAASSRFLMPTVTYAGSEQGEFPELDLGEEIITGSEGHFVPGLKSGYSSDSGQFEIVRLMQTAQDIMGTQEELDEETMISAPSWLMVSLLCGFVAVLRRRG
jgi:hypothetical protein